MREWITEYIERTAVRKQRPSEDRNYLRKYLPEATPTHFRIFTQDDLPPEDISALLESLPSSGSYGAVFDYKFVSITAFFQLLGTAALGSSNLRLPDLGGK